MCACTFQGHNVGITGSVLEIHTDGSEHSNANASEMLTDTQGHYSQIQMEALVDTYRMKKFYQFLYRQNFVLVTDHNLLVALFSTTKTPVLAANGLAKCALTQSQHAYFTEYQKTVNHDNVDSLSHLLAGDNARFDREEQEADMSMVYNIKKEKHQLGMRNKGLKQVGDVHRNASLHL